LCEKKLLLIWFDKFSFVKVSHTRKAIRQTRSTETIQAAKLMFGEHLAELDILVDGEVT